MSQEEAAPPLQQGRYRLVETIGAGGTATVYRARDTRLGVERAIKVLDPELARRSGIRRRFENEGRTMATLQHASVVSVYDVGQDDDERMFIVMELVRGASAVDHLRQYGPLHARQAYVIVRAVLEALHHAHERGVVHRDIKPHNILLTETGSPKVTDFGIAQVSSAAERSLTKTGVVLGTLAYMAPEQRLSARSVDARSDLYATGATLYALLTNDEPYDAALEPRKLSLLYAPAALFVPIILTATRFSPDERYSSAREMLDALDALESRLPPLSQEVPRLGTARPPPPRIRMSNPEPPTILRPRTPAPGDSALTFVGEEPAEETPTEKAPVAAAQAPGRHPAGTVLGDRFVLEQLVAVGGMGEIYRARDTRTGELAAVKVAQRGGDNADRFLREARALARLQHPGVVRHVAHAETPLPFLAMEWLDGEDLGTRLSHGPLPVAEALIVARGVAQALAATHAEGIVHRDVKPGNIFLLDGRADAVKLLDFGVAHLGVVTRGTTHPGHVLGTLGYMAPEQARGGEEVTPAADVFALGAVLFEALTGRAAFPGSSAPEVLTNLLFAEPPRLRDVRRSAAAPIDALLAGMMRKAPEDRPSIAIVVATIDQLLASTAAVSASEEADPVALTTDERRVIAVVAADRGVPSPTKLEPVADEVEAQLEALGDGTTLLVLHATGVAADLAADADRCAREIVRLFPGAGVAVAVGRGDPGRSLGEGDVAERALRLLSAQQGRGIVHDATASALLDGRFDTSRSRSRAAPLVGRDRERAFLLAVAEETRAEPLASVVIVTGPPGSGKSRLVADVARELGWPVQGLPSAPTEPTLVVLDGLAESDPADLALLDDVLRESARRPLLVLATSRDASANPWPRRRVTHLALHDLAPGAATRLIRGILGPMAPDDRVAAIVDRAVGQPFLAEELARAARSDARTPEAALVTAQAPLERLDPVPRRVLRAASVLGDRFTAEGVAALLGMEGSGVGSALDPLVSAEIVSRSADGTFAFGPGLVREAAHGMLTVRDRRVAHKLAAEWLEATSAGQFLPIAEHLERAGERQGAIVWYLWSAEQALDAGDLEASSTRAARGLECGARGEVAGELRLLQAIAAGGSGSPDRHAELARAALAALSRGTGPWFRAIAETAEASRRTGDAAALRTAATSLAQLPPGPLSVGSSAAVARVAVELYGAGFPEMVPALVSLLTAAQRHADADDAPILAAYERWIDAVRALYAGLPQAVLDQADAVLTALAAAGERRAVPGVALVATIAAVASGDDARAVSWGARAADTAAFRGLGRIERRARLWLAIAGPEGLEEARRHVERTSGDHVAEAEARLHLAERLLLAGDAEGAEGEARVVTADPAFPSEARGRAMALVAEVLIGRGKPDEALLCADEALELHERGAPLGDARARIARAEALVAIGAARAAEEAAADARDALLRRLTGFTDPTLRRSFLALPDTDRTARLGAAMVDGLSRRS